MLCDVKECYICKRKSLLEEHHIYFGKDRKKSDKYGFTCWLCIEHHRGTYGVHGTHGKEINLKLKRAMQEKFEKEHSREEFMSIIHKCYL